MIIFTMLAYDIEFIPGNLKKKKNIGFTNHVPPNPGGFDQLNLMVVGYGFKMFDLPCISNT